MARLLKMLHIVGLVVFLGSIPGHVVSSVLGGAPGPSADFILARRHILLASQVLTMPGLYLAVVSGVAMMIPRRPRDPWLLMHGALGLAILVLALTVVMPSVHAVLACALATTQGRGDVASIASAYQRESIAGGLNLALGLGAIALAVWRPQPR